MKNKIYKIAGVIKKKLAILGGDDSEGELLDPLGYPAQTRMEAALEEDEPEPEIEETPEEPEEESASDIVRKAIQNSLDSDYFQNIFLTRNPGPDAEGSVFDSPQTPESLMSANWERYDHPDVQAPAQAFKANIPGTFGIVDINDLSPDMECRATLGHKGEDAFVNILVEGVDVPRDLLKTDFTTILLGPGDDGLVVWTFFPGPPVMPSTQTPDDLKERGASMESIDTVRKAVLAGFTYAKVINM